MSRRRQHYDPIVQSTPPPAPELPPLRAVVAATPGVYLLAADVVAVLARMAEQEHGEGRAALRDAVEVFGQVDRPDALEAPEGPPEPVVVDPSDDPVAREGLEFARDVAADAAASLEDAHPDVARVEVYPAGDPRLQEAGIYWHARAVNGGGAIVGDGVQGVSREGVLEAAAGRWPGKPVYEIADAMGDSISDEQPSSTTFNGQRRPSTARLWGRT